MKLKRNDPCHCGSGKKYKHCHMREDQAEKAASQKAVAAQSERSLSTLLPDFETQYGDADQRHPGEPWAELYSRFAKAEYTEKKSVLRSAIEEDELDGETVFELFNQLYPQMMANGDEREFLTLLALARSHQAAYKEENHWFWEWEIVAALKADDEDALQRVTDELIGYGGHDMEHFLPSFNCLLYHGKLEILYKAIDKFEPASFSDDYFGNTLKIFQDSMGYLILLNYIESHEQSELLDEANVDQLTDQIARYSETLHHAEIMDFLSRVGGLINSTWTLDDFQLDPIRHIEEDGWFEDEDADGEEDPAHKQLHTLGREFIYYAHHTEGHPLTKAYLAEGYLTEYLTLRQVNQILAEDEAQGWPGREYYTNRRKRTNADLLLPTYMTVEEYLQRFFSWFANGTYQGIAFFTLLPTWVRFIVSKGLADPKDSQQSLKELEPLRDSMEPGLSKHPVPKLVADLRQWEQDEEMTG